MSINTDFMKPEIINIKESGYSLTELFAEDSENISIEDAVFAYRLSASGYMDATDWGYAFTEAEAIASIVDMFYQDVEEYPTDELRQWFISCGFDEATVNRIIV